MLFLPILPVFREESTILTLATRVEHQEGSFFHKALANLARLVGRIFIHYKESRIYHMKEELLRLRRIISYSSPKTILSV